LKDFISRLRAWLGDPMTEAFFTAVCAVWCADMVLSAHRRISNVEDDLRGIVCSLPLRPVHRG